MAEKVLQKLTPGVSDKFFGGMAAVGLKTPMTRFIVGSAVGALAVYAIRPATAFNADRTAKKWSLLAHEGEPSTSAPWFVLALIPGVLFSTFL
jgi:hypothetical protein